MESFLGLVKRHRVALGVAGAAASGVIAFEVVPLDSAEGQAFAGGVVAVLVLALPKLGALVAARFGKAKAEGEEAGK